MKLTLAVLALVALPLTSFAATYFYVDTEGDVASVEANTEADALVRSVDDRHTDSGVSIDQGLLERGENVDGVPSVDRQTYQYVSRTGDIMSITAPTPEMAIANAPNIAPTSGVLIVEEADEPLSTSLEVPIDPTPPVTP